MKEAEKRQWLMEIGMAIIASKAGSEREAFLFEWYKDLGGFKFA